MAITRTNSNETLNPQSMDSYSFDQKYKMKAVMVIGEDTVNNAAIRIAVDPNGKLLTVGDSMVPSTYDSIIPTFNTTSDVWVFKTGGVSGTTVSTLTINYVDSTKAVITNILKT